MFACFCYYYRYANANLLDVENKTMVSASGSELFLFAGFILAAASCNTKVSHIQA